MENIGEAMGFKTNDNGETISPYRKIYERLAQEGKIAYGPDKKYKCNKCKDTGWITDEENGIFTKRPCKCLAEKMTDSRLKKTGVSAEDYKAYKLETFNTDTAEHAKMKSMAIRYIKERRRGESIIYTGNSGTGKTHICIAVCQELTRQYGENHRYFSYRSEIQRLKQLMYKYPAEYAELMKVWYAADNLFIDDLFKLADKDDLQQKTQQQDMQIMFDIINMRYINKKATIFSSEKAVTDMIDEDQALGSRIKSMVGSYGMACHGNNARLK